MSLDVGKDSYLSLQDADAYWDNHNHNERWQQASEQEKEAALREATRYVDNRYTWIGKHPGSSGQVLSWPRMNAVDKQGRLRTGIPQEVKDATAYLAQQSLEGGLLAPQDRGGRINRVQADTVVVEWDKSAPSQPTYDYADLLLKNITTGGRSSAPLLKA
jgi:hypothetical protein